MCRWNSVWMIGAACAAALAAAPGSAETLTLSAEDCARIVKYVPAPDVAYKPGVDVYGNAVAPADLAGSPKLDLPDTYTFDINIDIGRYLGVPKAQAAAASSAVIAADKAKSAVTSATSAASSAETAATKARAVADKKKADAATAKAAANTANDNLAADPLNQSLKDAAATANAAYEAAASAASTADSQATAIETAAATATSRADTADAATTTADKASVASSSASAAAEAASLASDMAGTATVGEDATVTALRSAASDASTAASSASSAASESATANTALESAYNAASTYGNLDMKVGTVGYDLGSGMLTFNGKPLSDPDAHALAEACAKAQQSGK